MLRSPYLSHKWSTFFPQATSGGPLAKCDFHRVRQSSGTQWDGQHHLLLWQRKKWPSFQSGIPSCFASLSLLFYDVVFFQRMQSTYYLTRVAPQLTLVVIFTVKKSEKDSYVFTFLNGKWGTAATWASSGSAKKADKEIEYLLQTLQFTFITQTFEQNVTLS